MSVPFSPRNIIRHRLYKFGNKKVRGVGVINIRITIHGDLFLSFQVEDVDVHVPLLISSEFLDNYQANIDLSQGRLVTSTGEW